MLLTATRGKVKPRMKNHVASNRKIFRSGVSAERRHLKSGKWRRSAETPLRRERRRDCSSFGVESRCRRPSQKKKLFSPFSNRGFVVKKVRQISCEWFRRNLTVFPSAERDLNG